MYEKKIGLKIGSCCCCTNNDDDAVKKKKYCNGNTHRISIVFALDVASLIKNIITQQLQSSSRLKKPINNNNNNEENHHSSSTPILGESYNISCVETPTFTEFVQDYVAKSLNVTELRWSKKKIHQWLVLTLDHYALIEL